MVIMLRVCVDCGRFYGCKEINPIDGSRQISVIERNCDTCEIGHTDFCEFWNYDATQTGGLCDGCFNKAMGKGKRQN